MFPVARWASFARAPRCSCGTRPFPTSALGPAEQAALLGEVRSSEPVYRIVVQLDRQTVSAYGAEHALLPGMALEADILLERRRLVEWVFEPLYALRGVENE